MPGDPYSTAALAGIQIWSGLQQAQMLREGAELQSKIDDMNAKYAEYDAWQVEKQGAEQQAQQQTKDQHTIGSQMVANAVNNVDSTFGTAAQLKKESIFSSFLNSLDIGQAAHARALGFKREAMSIRLGSYLHQAQAGQQAAAAQMNAVIGAAGTVGTYAGSKFGYNVGRG